MTGFGEVYFAEGGNLRTPETNPWNQIEINRPTYKPGLKTRGQFSKEIQCTLQVGHLFLHQFESTKSLYKFPLQTSNLYL